MGFFYSSHICTVGDDFQALIWDLSDIKQDITGLFYYKN